MGGFTGGLHRILRRGRSYGTTVPDAARFVDDGEPRGLFFICLNASIERQFVAMILDPTSEWEKVSEGHEFTEGPAVDRTGNVFFSDIPKNRIHKIGVDGRVSVFKENTGEANGLMFGADGRLYACQNGKKRIVAYSTCSQLGYMFAACGLGAYAAALWHIVAHGLFKAWLFLGSGSAIGMKSESQRGSLSNAATAAIAIGTLCIAVSYLVFGNGSASLVPLLLGMATAMATMVACLGSVSSLRTKLSFLLLIAALVAFHTVGLSIAHSAVGADAQALLPNWVLLALLATFLGCWVWQQHRLLSGAGLPARLFVHLINAGALKATRKGEAA